MRTAECQKAQFGVLTDLHLHRPKEAADDRDEKYNYSYTFFHPTRVGRRLGTMCCVV